MKEKIRGLGMVIVILSLPIYSWLHLRGTPYESSIVGFVVAAILFVFLGYSWRELLITIYRPSRWTAAALAMVLVFLFFELSRNHIVSHNLALFYGASILSGFGQELYFRGAIPATLKRIGVSATVIELVEKSSL